MTRAQGETAKQGITARDLRRAWVLAETPEQETAAALALAAHRRAHPEDKS
jgi:hypothetical protein